MSSNATAELSETDVQHKARAEHYLAEAQKILNRLEGERKQSSRNRLAPTNIVAEVKAILRGDA